MLPDIGFGELLLVALVALFVVGPERLPAVAQKLGVYWANTRYYVQGMLQGFWQGEGRGDEKKSSEKET